MIFDTTINIPIINSPQGSFPLFAVRRRPLLGRANPNDWPGSDQMRLQTITGLFPAANFLPLTAEQPPQATNKHPQSLLSTSLGLWCSAISVSWPLTYTPPSIRQLKMYAQLASDLWCEHPLILRSHPMLIDPPAARVSAPPAAADSWSEDLELRYCPHPGLLTQHCRGASRGGKNCV